MKAPLSWLKDYVDIDVTAQELQEKLFGCGFEVEELIYLGKDITNVVVGEVTECEPVEGTHLSVCKVDCGEKGILRICCGGVYGRAYKRAGRFYTLFHIVRAATYP